MIHDSRLAVLRDGNVNRVGKYVLYWMQASQRAAFNHALEYCVREANAQGLPPLVCFGLTDRYPEANERHYAFMLEGLRDVESDLRTRGIRFVVRRGSPPSVALGLARDATMIVCDRGYTRHQRRWRDEVADGAPCGVVQVESDVVVPVEVASDHHEFAARTIRPKIHRHLDEYLQPLRATKVKRPSLAFRVAGEIDVSRPAEALAKLTLDRSVGKSNVFEGGYRAARTRLERFVKLKLRGYARRRNEPADAHTSTLSAYLHFGQISPLEVALVVRAAPGVPVADRHAYLEELIVRRELSVNFVHFNPHYDRYECLPDWARKALARHARDRRPVLYTRAQLEAGETHDPYWNAAQREMVVTGYMHNYMRMYWGKKILEWTRAPAEAFATALYLNNKYFLCGRDPNGWANVAWVFGLHDRPWGPERPIFGLVRYMNEAGLRRKFDMDAYVSRVQHLA